MDHVARRTVISGLAGGLSLPLIGRTARADDATEARIAFGNGIAYLPFYVGRKKGLFVKALVDAGLPNVKVTWPHVAGTSALNDAMLSGSIDMYVAGTPGVLIVWDRTKGRSNAILGCAGVTTLPLQLMTVTDRLKSLADFGPTDRIAMPSIVGTPATVIRMACEQTFGPGEFARLNANMVALAHPEAMAALLNRSEVTAYLGSPPFTNIVQRDKQARVLLNSPDVYKQPASFVLLSVRKVYAERNPRVVSAIVAGLQMANDAIAADPAAATDIYLEAEPSKYFTPDLIAAILREPSTQFTTRPRAIMRTAEFMTRTGEIRTAPKSWTDVFIAGSGDLDGD